MSYTASSREKNKIYVITLVSRDKRQIVGYDIAFDKSRERIQRLVDNSPKASKYYSDAYRNNLLWKVYFVKKQKSDLYC